MKHTAGPWTVVPNTHHSRDLDLRSYIYSVKNANLYRCLAKIEVLHVGENEAEANAHRIVACVNACKGINPEAIPELLEALQLMVVCTYGKKSTSVVKAEVAIAKATAS